MRSLRPEREFEHVAALVEDAGIDAEIRQVTVGIGRDLEGQRAERFGVGGLAGDLVARFRIASDDLLGFQRRGHVFDHRIEQRLNALVLEGRTAEHRQHRAFDRRPAQRRLHAIDRQLLAVEEDLEQLVVLFGDRLNEVLAPLQRELAQLALDLFFGHRRAEVVGVDDLLHREQIDDALKLIFGADRHLNRYGAGAEALANLFDHVEEVGADAVHLVDEDDARNFIFVRLTPDGLRLGLHRGHRVEERDQAVEHAQRALDLDGEIDVPRRVDDVDARIPPGRGGRGRGDRNAAFLFLNHPVHRRRAVVHFTHLVHASGKEEDTFGTGRLAGINVRGNADIPRAFERIFPSSHGVLSLKCYQR